MSANISLYQMQVSYIFLEKRKQFEICKKYFVFLWIQQTFFISNFDYPVKISDQNKQQINGVTRE